jgi:hypothetical protein
MSRGRLARPGRAPEPVALAEGLPDQVRTLRLGIAFWVVRAAAPGAGQFLIGAVISGKRINLSC